MSLLFNRISLHFLFCNFLHWVHAVGMSFRDPIIKYSSDFLQEYHHTKHFIISCSVFTLCLTTYLLEKIDLFVFLTNKITKLFVIGTSVYCEYNFPICLVHQSLRRYHSLDIFEFHFNIIISD